jgi:3',5'-cyclic AMP phosphodiesterase CpdA
MRGRVEEYQHARAYLDRLPKPVFTIPGNHDQPLSLGTAWERLTTPWARYTQYIHGTIDATLQMPGAFVVGVNTNHRILPGGIWSGAQRRWIAEQFRSAAAEDFKVLVMHHHLNWNGRWRPFGHWFPTSTLNWLAGLGVALVLNGHTHVPITIRTPQGIVIAQCGTTMSTRVRHGEGNSYNRIRIEPDTLAVGVWGYDETTDRFVQRSEQSFPQKGAIHALRNDHQERR